MGQPHDYGAAASAATLTIEEAVEPDFERDPSTGKVENDDSARHGWSITEPFSDDERDDGRGDVPGLHELIEGGCWSGDPSADRVLAARPHLKLEDAQARRSAIDGQRAERRLGLGRSDGASSLSGRGHQGDEDRRRGA
jgi:hypothetical protein